MRFRAGVASRTSDGSLVGGDMVAVTPDGTTMGVVVVDIAGNGWIAAPDAWRLRADVDASLQRDPGAALRALHDAMSRTRGAVAAAMRFEQSGRVRYAGVGDVRIARWRSGSATSMGLPSGQLGHVCPTIVEQTTTAAAGDVYAVVTDGIRTSMPDAVSTRVLQRDPSELAASILRDWCKEHDDATCVVVRVGW